MYHIIQISLDILSLYYLNNGFGDNRLLSLIPTNLNKSYHFCPFVMWKFPYILTSRFLAESGEPFSSRRAFNSAQTSDAFMVLLMISACRRSHRRTLTSFLHDAKQLLVRPQEIRVGDRRSAHGHLSTTYPRSPAKPLEDDDKIETWPCLNE